MDITVLDWLDRAAETAGGKTAYASLSRSLTFAQVRDLARRTGSALLRRAEGRNPAAVLSEREVTMIPACLGAVCGGRAYAPVDPGYPEARIAAILRTLKPSAVLTDRKQQDKVSCCLEAAGWTAPVLLLDEAAAEAEDPDGLARARRSLVATDPLYIIFTSGSTGTPKGVVTSHLSLMSYIQAYAEMMDISAEDRLGCQAPLDYLAAIRDIYLPLLRQADTFLIPHGLFLQADRLAETLREREITALGWSASALTLLASMGFLDQRMPDSLRKICFSGSVLPAAVLRKWQDRLPGVRFVNQYGPTEATASCTWYAVDHPAEPGEEIPIGVPYANYRILLLREDGTEAPPGEQGEICVAGPCLALGYYGDPERTGRDFVVNPLQGAYAERIYRTGDLGSLRADGNLMFHGRKDRMIKHMGHRIELDEVESAAAALDGVRECAAVYQAERETLHLFYAGGAEKREIAVGLRKVLPGFMIPRAMTRLEKLPRLPNGKTDLVALKALAENR